jgi:uncharacterized protein YjcR
VFLFLVSLNNQNVYAMLELALQVSQVAKGSSTGCSVPSSTCRTWTREYGWEEEKEEEDGVR